MPAAKALACVEHCWQAECDADGAAGRMSA